MIGQCSTLKVEKIFLFFSIGNMFYIQYEVKGFIGEYQVGPYSEAELRYHLSDIMGYESIKNVRVISAKDING